ncbi:MAG: exodeoxyribonuclease VII small subunit [Anaerolineaceae bacterium]
MPDPATPSMDFESTFTALQKVITKLESSELPLEEALRLYEEGKRLSALCASILAAAQLRVTSLSDGTEEAFPDEAENE